MPLPRFSTPLKVVTLGAFTLAATGAGAATLHRFTATETVGSGALGATTYLASSGGALQGQVGPTTLTNFNVPFGIFGIYNAASTGIGVAGVSATAYGVGAGSYSSTYAALYGIAETNGDALAVTATGTGTGIFSEAEGGGAALFAQGDEADGVDSYSQTDDKIALYGEDDSTDYGYGVDGNSTSPAGYGVAGFGAVGTYGESESGKAGLPSLQAFTQTAGTELFSTQVPFTASGATSYYETASMTYPSAGYSGTAIATHNATSDLQMNGDVLLTGALYTGCKNFPETNPGSDCTKVTDAVERSNTGALVQTYASHHASSTMEDEGEAQLVNGYAHVSLDPTYAAAISTRTPYLVFTTPQGDGPGLFVTRRTATGFDVRQSMGGRSNMTFDYRIVAHPFGEEARRMAFVRAGAEGIQRPIAAGSRIAALHKRMALDHAAHGALVKRHHEIASPFAAALAHYRP